MAWALGVAPAAMGAFSWTGTWSTTFGEMRLSETIDPATGAQKVTGPYDYIPAPGLIDGTAAGDVLTGTWLEHVPFTGTGKGPLVFTMSQDGLSFTGLWNNEGLQPTLAWNGTRSSAPQPRPASTPDPVCTVIRRFDDRIRLDLRAAGTRAGARRLRATALQAGAAISKADAESPSGTQARTHARRAFAEYAAAGTRLGAAKKSRNLRRARTHLRQAQTAMARALAICDAAQPPLAPDVDSDGDGLLDRWETQGLDDDGDGTIDLDLPGMGANRLRRDVFLEIDPMPGHELLDSSMAAVQTAFAQAPVSNPDGSTGISLHIDNGPSSLMNPLTGARWSARSRSAAVPHVTSLGTGTVTGLGSGQYDWTAFMAIKDQSFPRERRRAFHYAISAHALPLQGWRALANVPGSDLVLGLGIECPVGHCSGAGSLQTGVVMHELGHNLGLRHGGGDGVNLKPNYLSVMNYMFTDFGLFAGGGQFRWDYSRFGPTAVPSLNEPSLSEPAGFSPASGPAGSFSTLFVCPTGALKITPVSGPVDWNCDGAVGGGLSADVNGDGQRASLSSFDDWANLQYKGGTIGALAAAALALPKRVTVEEPRREESLRVARVVANDAQAPVVTKSVRRRPGRVDVTLTARDNNELAFLAVVVDGTQRSVRPKQGRAVFRATFRSGRHTIRYAAQDTVGNASKRGTINANVARR